MAEMTGSQILGRALKNEGTKDLFFLLGGPMMHAESSCALAQEQGRQRAAASYVAADTASLSRRPTHCSSTPAPYAEDRATTRTRY